MKLLNIFKKVTSTSSVTEKINIQKMDAKQLSKVIGGTDKTVVGGGPVIVGGSTASGS